MKEILLSIYDTMRQRFKSPFIGAYVVSFFVYNWWPVSIYLRSDKKIEEIVKHLTKEYSNGWAYFVPLIFAVVYVAALPYINALFDGVSMKANLYRIKKRNLVKHERLEQDVKTAELERKVADVRAGTTEKETMLLRVQAAERQAETANKILAEQEQRHTIEQENFARTIREKDSEILVLKNEVATLNNNVASFQSEVGFHRKIYPYFLKTGKNSKVEIAHFLKKYLSEEEIIKLKEEARNQGSYKNLPFREEVNALLFYADLYKYDEKTDFFFITDSGIRFVNNTL
jgi:hypothetical protein